MRHPLLILTLTLGLAFSVLPDAQPAAVSAVPAAVLPAEVSADGAHAEASSFDTLVRALKAEDDVICTSPPFMWLARLVVKVAQPEGVTDVRLATFEGGGLSRVAAGASFGRLLRRVSDEGWSPLVRVRSRRNGQVTAVHVRQDRQRLSLLVVTIERGEAVVVEASVRPEALTRWLDEPRLIASRTR